MNKVKHNLYIPKEVEEQLRAEAKRQDRSMSWLIAKAWNLSYAKIAAMPSNEEPNE